MSILAFIIMHYTGFIPGTKHDTLIAIIFLLCDIMMIIQSQNHFTINYQKRIENLLRELYQNVKQGDILT